MRSIEETLGSNKARINVGVEAVVGVRVGVGLETHVQCAATGSRWARSGWSSGPSLAPWEGKWHLGLAYGVKG